MSTVYIVEDQDTLREFIVRLVKSHSELELVGQASDGLIGLEECKKLQPEVIVLDVILPGLNGVDFLRFLKREIPGVKVLGFSGFPSAVTVRQMIDAGVDGLVRKPEKLSVLEHALELVASGQTYFSPDVMDMIRQSMLHPEIGTRPHELNSRENEVLQLIAEGNGMSEIADILSINGKAAETYKTNIMRKLELHDIASLVRYAAQIGLVSNSETA